MIFLALLAAAPASGQGPQLWQSFFSVSMDRIGTYPLCESPDTPPEKICANKLDGMITFDLRTPPKYLTRNIWVDLGADGKPMHASARTSGVAGQEDVLKALKLRYGQPKVIKVEQVHNAFNASFPSIHARWVLPNKARVDFVGVTDNIEEGEVNWWAP
ncbi:hypothetical protein EOE18_13155 [Novosphingobium umbonatum]|uniref:Uncharacterized protein n=1 Tax=Novosphingobium umbonatum TaxID=1908524 RepID=A0A437N2E5_9SPHN|nr:hypothetical protein [Novosphingobium umbonatum]RVU04114.1 hypothetical protein EOE18_13155 [Novosphingobium umbonatum]